MDVIRWTVYILVVGLAVLIWAIVAYQKKIAHSK